MYRFSARLSRLVNMYISIILYWKFQIIIVCPGVTSKKSTLIRLILMPQNVFINVYEMGFWHTFGVNFFLTIIERLLEELVS